MRTGLPQPVGRSADVLFGGVQRTRLDVAGPSQTHEQRTNMEHEQDKSNEEHGQLRQAGVSRSFSDVLRSFGFRRCKSYAKGITCFISACGHRYAEVYTTETWGKWAWATGDGLPQDPGCPGGKAYHEPHRLHEVLSSCG